MAFRISPMWWPVLGTASPVLVPLLLGRNRNFKSKAALSAKTNRERRRQAGQHQVREVGIELAQSRAALRQQVGDEVLAVIDREGTAGLAKLLTPPEDGTSAPQRKQT